MSAVPLVDVKVHLNLTVSTYDTELQTFIDAAEAVIGARCGLLAPTAVTEQATASRGLLVLGSVPAVSLTSITPVEGGDPISLSGVTLNKAAGVASGVPAGSYDVVYQAGRATVPADLALAVKEMVRHLWDTQRGPTRRPGSTAGDSAANTIPGAGYLLPFRVSELIAPHLMPGFA